MLLKKLTEASGVSSREDEIRKVIKDEIKEHVDNINTDVMGNLIVSKNINENGPKLMLAAHMDEVGLMITAIEDNGLLKFRTAGGIDKRVLVSKSVVLGKEKIPGVIGSKAIHLQKPDERKKPIPIEKLYIDIGAENKKVAEDKVNIGDMAVFTTNFAKMGDNHARGKAFDDRIGCAAIIELLKKDFPYPVYGVFAVQEEVGLRGAARAAYSIEPDLALVIEGTTASDVPESDEYEYSTSLGCGPALTIMDSSLVANKKILRDLINIAEKNDIPYQYRRSRAGGTDAGMINLTKDGIPSAVVSQPCRYIHSPVSLINLEDFNNLLDLMENYMSQTVKEDF